MCVCVCLYVWLKMTRNAFQFGCQMKKEQKAYSLTVNIYSIIMHSVPTRDEHCTVRFPVLKNIFWCFGFKC